MSADRSGFVDHLLQSLGSRGESLVPLLKEALATGESPVRALERSGLIDPAALTAAVASHYRLPMMAEADWPADPAAALGFSRAFLKTSTMFPLGPGPGGTLAAAVADPGDTDALSALALAAGKPVRATVASAAAILRRLDALPPEAAEAESSAEFSALEGDEEDLALDAPVVELLNRIFADAATARATDIHLEPGRGLLAVRLRIDGVLRPYQTVNVATGRSLLARVKILAGLNIAERRLPQDGNIRTTIGHTTYDLRVATVPVVHGEGAVIRLLASSKTLPALGRIGFSPAAEERFRAALASAYGLVLVTGPTGSGKTTTLAASVSELNDPSRKILTIEDPVEYEIAGISQVRARPDIGLGFAEALRAFLRSDPDVILVGEIRDAETARIAVQASLTGHLVLSTLHTNSAAAAVTRLIDMGVEPFLLAATLRASVGQRLVRLLCRNCRRPVHQPLPFAAALLREAGRVPGALEHFHLPGQCDDCAGTGYYGRAAIFEVMSTPESLTRLIQPGVTAARIHAAAVAGGMQSLAADGVSKILAGLTSPDEVLRVTHDG